MGVLLTAEEIEELNTKAHRPLSCIGCDIIAKAQLKKVVEWGEEDCEEHGEPVMDNIVRVAQRHRCSQCWQALLKEAEDDGRQKELIPA